MRRELSFGEVDYNGRGRKDCPVTIEVEIKADGELSICGNIWNHNKSDCYSCGQNLDTIAELLPHNKKVQRIVEVWKRWHLNGMKAGSPAQEEHLRVLESRGIKCPPYPASHYDWASEQLAAVGLNPDPNYLREGKPYKYGHAWIKEELPAEIVAEVESWFPKKEGGHDQT